MVATTARTRDRAAGRLLPAMLWLLFTGAHAMTEPEILILDDRQSGDLTTAAGKAWRFVGDSVMGGVSSGRMSPDNIGGRPCLRLQGEISLDNNGGFIQGALAVPENMLQDITAYQGIVLDVYGNDQEYNLHLRTANLWLPWQSYRATFPAAPQWQRLYLPFSDFDAYRTGKQLDTSRLERIGIVAIGRVFNVDVCVGMLGLYR